ncbi:MAG: DUF4367 domain-containing protein [Clostridiaceae bacterium]|jgi:hypothetical protein|nr:DUF4367 domain-containing protein [Clostridiaceae bacterium]
MSYSFSEEMLRDAVIKADLLEINALPENIIEHKFSRRFERKMKHLISRNRITEPIVIGRPVYLRRRLIAVLIAIILLLASVMSVSAIREKVFELIIEVYEKYTQLFFEKSQSTNTSSENFSIYVPTYIPDGFSLVYEDMDGTVLLEYEKGNEYISYRQVCPDEVSMHINTEGIELEDFIFNDLPAKYYSNEGVQNLIWYDNSYMYRVSSTLDKTTVLRIAESIEPEG